MKSYYLVAYRPRKNHKNGTFHRIEVKLKRKHIHAQYRQGYVTSDPVQVSSDDIISAFKFTQLHQVYPFEVNFNRILGSGDITFSRV